MAFWDSSVKVIKALLPRIFDMGDMAYAKEITLINNKQIKLAFIIGKIRISSEENRCGSSNLVELTW